MQRFCPSNAVFKKAKEYIFGDVIAFANFFSSILMSFLALAVPYSTAVTALTMFNKGKKYIFSRGSDSASTPIRGYQVIAQLSSVATPKLKHPENVRCTKLRKHLATLSQLLDLKHNELEQLANHMGHDVTVHRNTIDF